MSSFQINIIIILEVCKSVWDCIVGCIWNRIVSPQSKVLLVGSNYGDRPDPNAGEVIKRLRLQGELVLQVVNTGGEAGTVRRGSLKAAYYFFSSKACFYTHSLSDIIPHAHKLHYLKNVFKFPRLVFLQHGVIGLKSNMPNGVLLKEYIKSLEPTFDYMVVSSTGEQELIEKFGVPRSKVAITGLPRFDRYHESEKNNKTVLIFFTWQNVENINGKFEQIQSSGVLETLRENGYEVKSASHDMQKKTAMVASISNDELQSAIASCPLLITDDSSVAWDFLYRKQEVIFLSPSKDWLCKTPFLLERRCFSAHELRDKVDAYLSKDIEAHDFLFAKHYDDKNTERVLSLVSEYE